MRSAIATSVFVSCLLLGFGVTNTNAKPAAAFSMPAGSENWKPDVFGQNGMYRFRQTDGDCQITFVQNLGADAARAAGRDPQDTLDAYINSLTAKVGEVTRNETSGVELPLASGEKVTFVSEEVTYTGTDSVAYHNRISTQWVGDVELLIIAACPSKDWSPSQDLLSTFLGKVTIVKGEMP